MTFLTVDQYKEYFSCDENTLILGSPQVAMIANLLGEKFVYGTLKVDSIAIRTSLLILVYLDIV